MSIDDDEEDFLDDEDDFEEDLTTLKDKAQSFLNGSNFDEAMKCAINIITKYADDLDRKWVEEHERSYVDVYDLDWLDDISLGFIDQFARKYNDHPNDDENSACYAALEILWECAVKKRDYGDFIEILTYSSYDYAFLLFELALSEEDYYCGDTFYILESIYEKNEDIVEEEGCLTSFFEGRDREESLKPSFFSLELDNYDYAGAHKTFVVALKEIETSFEENGSAQLSKLFPPNTNAFTLLRVVACNGYPTAQYTLGMTMLESDAYSNSDAEEWFARAAANGFAKAQYLLGKIYFEGNGILQDFSKAIHLFQAAIELGDIDSLYYLGVAAYYGRGTEKDIVTANAYLNVASANGNNEASSLRDACLRKMKPGQIEEGQKLSREYAKRFLR